MMMLMCEAAWSGIRLLSGGGGPIGPNVVR